MRRILSYSRVPIPKAPCTHVIYTEASTGSLYWLFLTLKAILYRCMGPFGYRGSKQGTAKFRLWLWELVGNPGFDQSRYCNTVP